MFRAIVYQNGIFAFCEVTYLEKDQVAAASSRHVTEIIG